MARRVSGLEAFVTVFSRLPAWACLGLALAAWFAFKALVSYCSSPPPAGAPPLDGMGRRILATPFLFAQYGIPGLLVVSALIGATTRASRRRKLAEAMAFPLTTLEALSWREFEQLLADAFRQQGFAVTEGRGRGPDGGVDLRLRRDGQVHLVQAKHW